MTAGVAVQPHAGERTRERLTFWAYRAGETAIGALPRGVVLPVAAAAGNVAYDLAGDKQALVRDNLARAMRPAGGPPEGRSRGAAHLPQLRPLPGRHDAAGR